MWTMAVFAWCNYGQKNVFFLPVYSKDFNVNMYHFFDKKTFRVIPHNVNKKHVYYNLCQQPISTVP